MKICIFTIIKNEQEYLEEWIKYHLDLGIDHLFIFEDNDIRIKDDKFVINLVSEIADTVYRFEISLIGMCSLYLQEEKNSLHVLTNRLSNTFKTAYRESFINQ